MTARATMKITRQIKSHINRNFKFVVSNQLLLIVRWWSQIAWRNFLTKILVKNFNVE